MFEQISDEHITASSYGSARGFQYEPYRSRFSEFAAWISSQYDTNQWIQADFLTDKAIFKVATKGRNEVEPYYYEWVTKYQLKYSLSGSEATFEYVTSPSTGGDIVTFNANSDGDSVVENEFAMIFARFFRLCPVEWHNRISMRWEVYGC